MLFLGLDVVASFYIIYSFKFHAIYLTILTILFAILA